MADPSFLASLDPVQEIDLLLAGLVAEGGEPLPTLFERTSTERILCVAGALRFLGIAAMPEDVESVLRERPGRFAPGSTERGVIEGIHRCLELLDERASSGRPPDGDFLLALWRQLSSSLPRSQSPGTRVSTPKDAMPWIGYPPPSSLPRLLSRFREEESFLDFPALFEALHPIRQSFRIFYRLARIAPFPEYNVLVAWLAASAYVRARGYPHLLLAESDAVPVRQLLMTGPPRRFPLWEERLLGCVRGLSSARQRGRQERPKS